MTLAAQPRRSPSDGIRIEPDPAHHKRTYPAGTVIVVRDITRPLAPHTNVCGYCGIPHDCKTYHLRLDEDGTDMVSVGVWNQLQRLVDNGGFRLVSHHPEPPTQGLVLPTAKIGITPAEL